MQHRKRNFAASLLLLGTVLSTAAPALAASSPAAGGVTVLPGQLSYLLNIGTTEQTQPLTITNNYDTDLHLAAEFKGIDETAGRLVPTNNLEANLGRSLYISQTDIHIAPHETQTFQVAITNPDSLSPGGHYATLVLTQQNDNLQAAAYRAAVSVSLYVIKVDGEKEHLTVSQFDTNGSLFRIPTTATIRFGNQGNIHVVPRAAISVLRHDNLSVIAKGIINQASLPLFPGKELVSTAPIQSFNRVWVPRKLDIMVAYRADGDTVPQYLHRTMLYIPPFYPVGLVLIGVFVVLLVRRFGRPQVHYSVASLAKKHTKTKRITVSDESATAGKRRKIAVRDEHDDSEPK